MSPPPRTQLAEVAAAARRAVAEAREAFPTFVDGEQPGSALSRLYWQSVTQASAAVCVACDDEAWPSVGVLLRAVLEGYAHIAWICDGTGGTSPSQSTAQVRAWCVELGAAKAQRGFAEFMAEGSFITTVQEATQTLIEQVPELRNHRLVAQALDGNVASELRAGRNELDSDANVIARSHRESGCSCAGRGEGHVQAILKALMEDDPLAHMTWRLGSSTAHNLAPDLGPIFSQSGMDTMYRCMNIGYATDLILASGMRCLGVLSAPDIAVMSAFRTFHQSPAIEAIFELPGS